MKTKQLAFLFLLPFALPASAADWFVATDGDDAASGSEQSPLATVAEALERAEPGDYIILREGAYDESINVRTPRINIRAYNDEHVHIAVPTDDADIEQAIRFGYEAENSSLHGLEVSGGYYYTLKLDSLWLVDPSERQAASHASIRRNYLHHSGRDVVKLTPGVYGAIIADNTIAHSGQRDDSNAECIDNVNADAARIYGNHIHDCATNGVYAKGGASGVVIEGNLVRNTGEAGILLGYTGTGAEWFDDDNDEGYENIEGRVRNNFVLNTEWAGIALWGSLDAMVYNNTLVDVAKSSQEGILLSEGGPDDGRVNPNMKPDIRNNIVVLSADSTRGVIGSRDNGMDGDWFIDYNVYHHEGGNLKFRFDGNPLADFVAWQNATGQGTHSTTVDPLLDANYHLTGASAALINMGLAPHDGMEDYEGHLRDDGAVDIGADEFTDEETLEIPPPPGTIGTGYAALNAPQPLPVPDEGDDDPGQGNDTGDTGDTGANDAADSSGGGGVLAWLLPLLGVLSYRKS